jgi:hypothetical protein
MPKLREPEGGRPSENGGNVQIRNARQASQNDLNVIPHRPIALCEQHTACKRLPAFQRK